MNESELYKELGVLTKEKDKWEESIPYVSSLLSHDSVKIKAKALWLLGESARDRSLFYFFCYQALFLLHKPVVKRMTLGLFHFCPKSAIIQSAKG